MASSQPDPYINSASDQNELVVLDPSHPLMSRFQNALKRQLTKQKEQLDQELREVSDALKRHKQERENIGVLLYGVQQELAKQQTEMEITNDKAESEKMLRETAEKDLAAQREVYEKASDELFGQKRGNAELQLTIEQLSQKIVYMEEAKKDVHADVRTLHRATAKAGVELAGAELDKRRQDIFVDRMTGRVENLTDEKVKNEAQLAVQQKETAAYRDMLIDAKIEIDAIGLDKKRLMQQWDSSIIMMGKRDEHNKKTPRRTQRNLPTKTINRNGNQRPQKEHPLQPATKRALNRAICSSRRQRAKLEKKVERV